MPARFFRDLSTSALQLLLNQALAFGLFLLLSRQLSKDAFGELSWCLALLLIVFTLAGSGLDAIVVRRIAAGEPAPPLLSAYLRHLLLTGFSALLLLAVFSLGFLSPATSFLLLLLASGKWILSLAQPLKAWASGRERFRLLLALSLPAALLKCIGALLLLSFGRLTFTHLAVCLALADMAEAAIGFWLLRREAGLSGLRVHLTGRPFLMAGTLPQLGVVLFGTLLARFDQVILGWLRPASEQADYAFCTKVFELCTLPLLAIGPLLLPRMSRDKNGEGLRRLLRGELALAMGTLLLLNLLWTPVIDAWTEGRYGARNTQVIFWLSLSLPLLYLNNFLWTKLFSAGQLPAILRTVALTFGLSLVANLLLIPPLGPTGAAIAFFAAQLLQCTAYLLRVGPRRFFTKPLRT